jgi:hypothetical protein
VASKVDIPLVTILFICFTYNFIIVVDYKEGVTATVRSLELKRTSIKSAPVLVIGGCVELKLELPSVQVSVC